MAIEKSLGKEIAALFNSIIVARSMKEEAKDELYQARKEESSDLIRDANSKLRRWTESERRAVQELLDLGIPIVGAEFILQ